MNCGGLYEIGRTGSREGHLEAEVHFHAGHAIYRGHFPGMPLTPGVCQLELLRECLELATGSSLQLQKARQIKFTRMHEPAAAPDLRMELDYSRDGRVLAVQASLRDAAEVYFKFKGSFIES